MPKYNFRRFFFDSIYRGYRDHFPDIAIATAKFPISRYRDDRDLSVCLTPSLQVSVCAPADADVGSGPRPEVQP